MNTTATLNKVMQHVGSMNLEDFLEFLKENNISYSRCLRFPVDGEGFIQIVPNYPGLTRRKFRRDHTQIKE